MNKKYLLTFAIGLLTIGGMVGCNGGNTTSLENSTTSSEISSVSSSESPSSELTYVDYAAQFKFDENASRAKEIVTVRKNFSGNYIGFVDGDTVHFDSKNGIDGVFKARFLAVNTPESTGQVEKWGKTASNFTKEKLSAAAEIMIESNSEIWEADSTGERFLAWVWYRPEANADWRLLNLELMQEGLAKASSINSTCYAEIMNLAYNQAMGLKLKYYSDEDDPNFHKGDAISLDLKELRTNIENYVDKKLCFDGLITRVAGSTAYVEDYDEETGLAYGMSIYMGFDTFDIIEKGNIVTFIGTCTYYEAGKTYQVSGLKYYPFKPNYSDNLKLVSENNEVTPASITAEDIAERGDDMLSTHVTMNNLYVQSAHTTDNGGDNDGAITLTCRDENNQTVKVRTSVIYKNVEDKELATEADFLNKTISISSGIVDKYEDDIQVHVFSYKDIIFA